MLRADQRLAPYPVNDPAVTRALMASFYAYTYAVEHSGVRRAAELRAEAMDVSDRGSRPVATWKIRCRPRSARCSCARSRRSRSPCIAPLRSGL